MRWRFKSCQSTNVMQWWHRHRCTQCLQPQAIGHLIYILDIDVSLESEFDFISASLRDPSKIRDLEDHHFILGTPEEVESSEKELMNFKPTISWGNIRGEVSRVLILKKRHFTSKISQNPSLITHIYCWATWSSVHRSRLATRFGCASVVVKTRHLFPLIFWNHILFLHLHIERIYFKSQLQNWLWTMSSLNGPES